MGVDREEVHQTQFWLHQQGVEGVVDQVGSLVVPLACLRVLHQEDQVVH